MKKLLTFSIAILTSFCASAQSYGDFMQQIIERSPQLRSLQASATADSLAARRGLNPENPEVEFEYFFGQDPSMELSIVQQFDFPTVYHQRNKIAKYTIERSKSELMAARRALLLEASELFNTLVYQTSLVNIFESRAAHHYKLDSVATSSLKAGNTTAVELSKLRMTLNATINELTEAQAAQKATLTSINKYGVSLNPKELQFAAFNFSGQPSQFIDAAMAGDWAIQSARVDSLIAGRNLKLARSEWAPGLKIGYKMEREIGPPSSTPRHAILAGITLPLWQNRNNVKHSKAQITASSANLRATETNLRANLQNLYDAYTAAQMASAQWNNISMADYYVMLDKSLKAGAISMMQYLFEITASQETERQILDAKYRTAQLGGQMALYLY